MKMMMTLRKMSYNNWIGRVGFPIRLSSASLQGGRTQGNHHHHHHHLYHHHHLHCRCCPQYPHLLTPSGYSEARVLAMPRWRVQVSTSASGAEFSAPGGEAGCSRLEGADGEGDRAGGEEGPKRGRAWKQPNGKWGERKDWRLEFTWFPKLTTPCFPTIYIITFQPFGLCWLSIEVPTTADKAKEKPCKAAS